MAGIGFELKKLFKDKGILAKFKAYGYSGAVCVGPMILGFILIFSIYILGDMAGLDKNQHDLLICMVTYTLLGSMIVNSIFSMVTTRYISDCIFERKDEKVIPALLGSSLMMMLIGSILYGIFLYMSGLSFVYQIICFILFNELLFAWNEMNFLSAIKDYKGVLFAFIASIVISLLTGIICMFIIKTNIMITVLAVLILAYAIMTVWYYILLLKYFPNGTGSCFEFTLWFDKFPQLILLSTSLTIGLFSHQVIIWHGEMGQHIFGLFYSSTVYDISTLLAFVSTIITLISFVTSVEVNFSIKYKEYFNTLSQGGRYKEIATAESEMKTTLINELSYTFSKQFFVTLIFISIGSSFISALPFGLSEDNLSIFRTLCIAYAFYIIGNCTMLILLYFSDNNGALFCALVFAITGTVSSIIFRIDDSSLCGYGFVIGSFLFALCSLLRLFYFLKNIEYHVLSCQPIIKIENKGIFTFVFRIRKGISLKRNRIYKGFKNFARITLIAIIMMTMTGCEIDYSEINKSEISGKYDANGRLVVKGNLPIKDNKVLYDNWDSTDIETMYLTVEEGNKSDNTNHSWSDVNAYSAYYYDEEGIDKYKVAGKLQVGDENGLVKDEFGYNDMVPNCTVQIRGQTSSYSAQKNYKISIMDEKGDWNGQTVINLNKHVGDGVRFRNMLSYNLMCQIDTMFSARTKFVHLYVKDDTSSGGDGKYIDYGLYTYVEQINKKYLKSHNLDDSGQLYKINMCEFHRYEDVVMLKSDKNYDEKKFEEYLEIKGNDDHSKLIELLDELQDYDTPIEDTFEKWFDEDNFFSWLAFQILLGNRDTQNRNTFLYSPLNIDKFYFISWDNDASLRRTENSLLEWKDGLEYEEGVGNYWGNVLFKRVLKNDKYREKLTSKIKEFRDILSEKYVTELVSKYSAITKEYVFSLPDITYESLTSEQFDKVVNALPKEIENNYNDYINSLSTPMPFFLGDPEMKDDKLTISWNPAYDFNNELITYDIQLSDDYSFENIIYEKKGLSDTSVTIDKLKAGQYFAKVTATNETGKSTVAIDYYVSDNGKEYGMKSFNILDDGKVEVYEYEE